MTGENTYRLFLIVVSIVKKRNLLYTAVTRGKRLVVLIGTKKALGMAIRRADTRQRYTALRRRLEEFSSKDLRT